jgi:hypothetical protein
MEVEDMMDMPQYMDRVEPNVVPCGGPCTTWLLYILVCVPYLTLICLT